MSEWARQLGWITVPVEPSPVEPSPVDDADEMLGLVSCLRCHSIYHYEASHYCPTELISPDLLSAELEKRFRREGWVSCLHCRALFLPGTHSCVSELSPRPPRRLTGAANRVRTGSLDDDATHVYPKFYGIRLGYGCWALSGVVDHEVRDRRRSRDWSQRLAEGTRKYETRADACYWREWYLRNNFLAMSSKIALAAFRQAIWQYSIQNYEPGHYYPSHHRRYLAMGAAEWDGSEVVINLGFWMGPPQQALRLETACTEATRAILRRWSEYVPQVKAGFAWSEVKI